MLELCTIYNFYRQYLLFNIIVLHSCVSVPAAPTVCYINDLGMSVFLAADWSA